MSRFCEAINIYFSDCTRSFPRGGASALARLQPALFSSSRLLEVAIRRSNAVRRGVACERRSERLTTTERRSWEWISSWSITSLRTSTHSPSRAGNPAADKAQAERRGRPEANHLYEEDREVCDGSVRTRYQDGQQSSIKPVECLWSGGDQPSPPHTHRTGLLLLACCCCVYGIYLISRISATHKSVR